MGFFWEWQRGAPAFCRRTGEGKALSRAREGGKPAAVRTAAYLPRAQPGAQGNLSTYCERCAGGWKAHWPAGSPCRSLCRHTACRRCASSRDGTARWTGQTQRHSIGRHTSSLETHGSLSEPALDMCGMHKNTVTF